MGSLAHVIVAALAQAAAPNGAPVPIEPAPVEDIHLVTAETDQQTRMTVPVRIGAHGPFRFLIDTGSQRTVLASEIAQRLALPSSGTLRVIGVAGTETVGTAQVDQMGLGTRSLADLVVPLLEAEHIGADGIVGIDGLQGQRVLLDFARNTLAVGEARTLGGDRGYEIVVTARRKSGQLIVTDATIDGVVTQVVIDTGTGTSIGNRALQRALRQKSPLPQATLISVTGQEAIADMGAAHTLGIRDIGITNLVIAFTDAPAFRHLGLNRRPALLLGMRELRLFGRVAIDFKTRRVLFDTPEVETKL